VIVVPLGHRCVIRFVDDHHHQDVGPDIPAGFGSGGHQAFVSGRISSRRVHAAAEHELVVAMLCGKGHAYIALPGGNQCDLSFRFWQQTAVCHSEVVAFEIALAIFPKLLHHGDEFRAVFVAIAEIVVPRP